MTTSALPHWSDSWNVDMTYRLIKTSMLLVFDDLKFHHLLRTEVVYPSEWTLPNSIHLEHVLFEHRSVSIYCTSSTPSNWLTVLKVKDAVHHLSLFPYASCYFPTKNKQVINSSQKDQTFNISLYTLYIVIVLFFFLLEENIWYKYWDNLTFGFYYITGITVMVWNRHKLGNTY